MQEESPDVHAGREHDGARSVRSVPTLPQVLLQPSVSARQEQRIRQLEREVALLQRRVVAAEKVEDDEEEEENEPQVLDMVVMPIQSSMVSKTVPGLEDNKRYTG